MQGSYDDLQVGKTYSSYREVCERLGEPVLAGNGKRKQVGKWAGQFSWEMDGYKWKITDIHWSEDREIRDLTAVGLRGMLICHHLLYEVENGNKIQIVNENENRTYREIKSESEVVMVVSDKDTLLTKAGLVNRKFFLERFKKKESLAVREFFREIRLVHNREVIMYALETLAAEKVIILNTGYHIVVDNKPAIATLWETAKINEIYWQVLQSIKCKDMKQVWLKKVQTKFYHRLEVELKQQMNITFIKEVFLITASVLSLFNYLETTASFFMCQDKMKNHSNGRSVERLEKHFTTAYNRYLRYKADDASIGGMKSKFYEDLPKDYVEINQELIQDYIKLTEEEKHGSVH